MADLDCGLRELGVAFRERYGEEPAWFAWAPGRVNIIGEHTDYTGGLAMPAAIDRRVLVALSPRKDRVVRVHSRDFKEELSFERIPAANEVSGWGRYIAGLVATHRETFPGLLGFDALISSDVPMGAGLSSSAALEVAFANGLRAMFALDMDDVSLARLCRRVENDYLGLSSGLLDQMASQLSRQGCFTILDFRDLSSRWVPAPHEWALVVLDSGMRRELATSAYEDRVRECRQGLELLGGELGPRHAREVGVDELAPHASAKWSRRLCHVVEENARVARMEELLLAGETDAAAALLFASHASLRDLFEVSTPELDLLQESAEEWEGCLGARMVGGGFGGCCLAVVRRSRLAGFSDALLARYREKTGIEGRAWEVGPDRGAGAIPRGDVG